jgi:hypothetical protein
VVWFRLCQLDYTADFVILNQITSALFTTKLALLTAMRYYSGCFCNVGGCQEALRISAESAHQNFLIGRVCSDSGHDVVNGRHTGRWGVEKGLVDCVCSLFSEGYDSFDSSIHSIVRVYNMMRNSTHVIILFVIFPHRRHPPVAGSVLHQRGLRRGGVLPRETFRRQAARL